MNIVAPQNWYERLVRTILSWFARKETIHIADLVCEYHLGTFDSQFVNWIKVIKTMPVGSQNHKELVTELHDNVLVFVNDNIPIAQHSTNSVIYVWHNIACLLASDMLTIVEDKDPETWINHVDVVFSSMARDMLNQVENDVLLRMIKVLNDGFSYFIQKDYLQYMLVKHSKVLDF